MKNYLYYINAIKQNKKTIDQFIYFIKNQCEFKKLKHELNGISAKNINLKLTNIIKNILAFNLTDEKIKEKLLLGLEELIEAKYEKERKLDPNDFFMMKICKIPVLTSDEQQKYFTIYKKTKDENIKRKLIEHNLRLVGKISGRYKAKNLTEDDLFQVGCIGLFTAVERFEPEKGFKFSTYANYWIRQSIMRTIHNEDRLIKVPYHALEKNQYIKKIMDEHSKVYNSELSLEELIEKTGYTKDQIEACKDLATVKISIDAAVSTDKTNKDVSLIDIIEDEEANFLDKTTDNLVYKELISDAMLILKEKERRIIELHYLNEEVLSLAAIGRLEEFKLTRERVRQIEKQALRKLKYRIYRLDKNFRLNG